MFKLGLQRYVVLGCLALPVVLIAAVGIAPALASFSPHFCNCDLLNNFWNNFRSNLFKPLLLFFFVGLSIPLLEVELEFPQAIYQGLTIYLLLSIGWRGGEELALLSSQQLIQAGSFMVIGFLLNSLIAILAYIILRSCIPSMRRVDAATVSAYYGSDSAGTFLACLGTLQAAKIAFAPYMPVMLAVMEIPGCLVGLFLVNHLRKRGLNSAGFMPDEAGSAESVSMTEREPSFSTSQKSVLREVFLNPGLFLLLSGIIVGYISRLQGASVVVADDQLFINLFQGMLCLFLMEMGITAAKRMNDLKQVDWRFIVFALVCPNIFALMGIITCRIFCLISGAQFEVGTYALFAVLCAAASYIAVPAVQRLAIPEASPTLPLAASLGVTFVYNVTLGIPLYLLIAQQFV